MDNQAHIDVFHISTVATSWVALVLNLLRPHTHKRARDLPVRHW
jgi:hypothetical protein